MVETETDRDSLDYKVFETRDDAEERFRLLSAFAFAETPVVAPGSSGGVFIYRIRLYEVDASDPYKAREKVANGRGNLLKDSERENTLDFDLDL